MGSCWSTPTTTDTSSRRRLWIRPRHSRARKRDDGSEPVAGQDPTAPQEQQQPHAEKLSRESAPGTKMDESQSSAGEAGQVGQARELEDHKSQPEKDHRNDAVLQGPSEPSPTSSPSVPEQGRFAYVSTNSKKLIGSAYGIRHECLMLSSYLTTISALPPFLGALDGTSALDKGVPWPVEAYRKAFERSEWYRGKVITAWLAKWVWECISDDSIFTPEAAQDIRLLSQRPQWGMASEDPMRYEDSVIFTRLVDMHGAQSSSGCSPGTAAYDHLQKVFVTPIKAAFHEVLLADEQVSGWIDAFAKRVWTHAMELRGRKGAIYATFHPDKKDAEYYKRQRRPEITNYLFHNQLTGFDYSPTELGGVEDFPNIPAPAPGVIVWYPEVTLEFASNTGTDDGITIRIIQASYTTTIPLQGD